MRIGIITHSYLPHIDGVVRSVEINAKYLRKKGHHTIIFAPSYSEEKMESEIHEDHVIRIPSLATPKFSGIEVPITNLLSPSLIRKIKNENLDIIHVQNPFLIGEFAFLLSKTLDIPLVFTYHTAYEIHATYVKYLTGLTSKTALAWSKFFSNRCPQIIAPSQQLKNKLIGLGIKSNITVVPTGLDFELINSCPPKNRDDLGFKTEDTILISSSRLGPEKRILQIVRKIIPLIKRNHNFKYIILGDGPDRPEILSLIQRENLEKNFLFTGNITHQELFSYLGTSDIFLIASKEETQGLVIYEALAKGLPSIAINEPWLNDINVESVIKTDWHSLIDEIEKLTNNKNYLNQLKSSAINFAKQFDANNTVDKLLEVYEQTIEESER